MKKIVLAALVLVVVGVSIYLLSPRTNPNPIPTKMVQGPDGTSRMVVDYGGPSSQGKVVPSGVTSKYVGRWADNASLMILKDDHTGTADGSNYPGGGAFTWRETGDDMIVFENWKGKDPDKNGQISPSGLSLHINGSFGYSDLMKQKEQ